MPRRKQRKEKTTQPHAVEPGSNLIPLLCLLACLATFLLLPLAITAQGFCPPDDLLRDVAKTVSGKAWGDVILMRPNLKPDLNTYVGWEMTLSFLHKLGLSKSGLLLFSIAGLASLAMLPAALFLRRPEIGVFVLLCAAVLDFTPIFRYFNGRPYLIGIFCLSCILYLWDRFAKNTAQRRLLILFVAIMTLRVWARSTIVMLGIPWLAILASSILTRKWRPLIAFSLCLIVGIGIGTLLTGSPIDFLTYNVRHFYVTLFSDKGSAFLVTELGPLHQMPLAFLFFVSYLGVRTAAGWNPERLKHPAFLLTLLGWLLSFFIARFWFEYGFPAMLVWIALDLQEPLESRMPRDSLARLAFTLFCVVALCLVVLKPHQAAWRQNPLTHAVNVQQLHESDPSWFPGEDGVLYAATMRVFFTFYHLFPDGAWKYSTGMEPGFMPEADLRVYEAINLTGASSAYLPWINKLRPFDRIVIPLGPDKGIDKLFPSLEWKFVAPDYWFGRPPQPAE
jgi:hypothetical protein